MGMGSAPGQGGRAASGGINSRDIRSGTCRLVILATLAGALGGCVDQMPVAAVGRGDVRNAIARGQMTSPKAATVALVSLEGAPAAVEAQFRQALSGDAASREIVITDAASARYLVRGYLSAYAGEAGGVEVSYTYDVFDAASHRREQRLADTVAVPSGGPEPWAAVTPAVVSTLTGRSADDLAVTLAGTPEAQASGTRVAATMPSGGPAATN